MQQHARVVVIGGGVLGCSVLYHLTKLGWSDILLIERKELTAGSTWHAAGGFHTINGNPNVARLQAYTCGIYREIQELSDQDVGAHYVGGLLTASTPARWDFLKSEFARHKVLGFETALIGPDEVKKLCPIMDVSDVIGAIFDPEEGYLDPSGATFAYAKAARAQGAKIARFTKVEGTRLLPNGEWEVQTDKGVVIAEHVVNCAGLWAREVGRMAGVELPLVPMEHHYLITEDLPELVARRNEIPHVADLDGGIYLRQEHKGVLLGVYEKNAVPWALKGTPWDYAENELLIPDLERLGDDLLMGFTRFPAVAQSGIKRVINGPFTFSPDGNPLVGPLAGLPGYWVAAGCMAGFVQGGGIGRTIAEWIVEGQPTIDVFGMDIARFDPKLPESVTVARAREFYSRRFDIPYPNETWPVGRPYKTSPLYPAHQAANAVFTSAFGIEVPAWFAAPGDDASEVPTFRRSNAFPAVAAEMAAVRMAVGLFDMTAAGKFVLSGPDGEALLRKVVASPLPAPGCRVPALLLAETGRMIGDANVARLADGTWLMLVPTFLQALVERWLVHHAASLDVKIANVSDALAGIMLAGPASTTLLDRLTDHHALGSALQDGAVASASVGFAAAHVVRSDQLGVPGFEIFTPAASLYGLYEKTKAAGFDLGLRDIGVRAYGALVMESAPGVSQREISQDYTVAQAGFGHLVDHARNDFIGAEAVRRDLAEKPATRLVGLAIAEGDADAAGYEPIWLGDSCVGHTTSGYYGHTVGYAMALGYVDEAAWVDGTEVEVTVLGERRRARIVPTPFHKG